MSWEIYPAREDIVAALLEEAENKSPPTNPERLAAYLGLTIVNFVDHKEYNLSRKARAFLRPSEKLIGVHRQLMRVQQRFSILHEIGHFVLPGHVEAQGCFEDDVNNFRAGASASNMMSKGVIALEIEANQFAADCLFQLDHFNDHISTKGLNWLNIIAAADMYVASIEATARRWVEKTKENCALVVFKPCPRNTETPLEVMYMVASNVFEKLFFSRLASGQKVQEDSIVHQLFYESEKHGSFADDVLRVQMPTSIVEFDMQLFTNRYRVFGLLTPID